MSARKSRVRIGIEIAIAALVLAAVFTWSESLLREKVGPSSRAEGAAAEPFAGATAIARELELPVEIERFGTVRARREATVAARVMGLVRSVAVEEGERVEAGQLLLTLSAEEVQARADVAGGRVEAARAQLEQARRDFERTRALQAKEAATRVELEQAGTGLAVAEAGLDAARRAAAGERAVAGYREVRAPFAGLVVERSVDPGDLASPGEALFRLETDGGLRLEVPVDEGLARGLRPGGSVRLRLGASSELSAGRIGELESFADPVTRTVLVKVDLPEGVEVVSGSFGRALFRTGSRRGLAVPSTAVRRIGGLATLRVLEEERPVTRHVRLGEELPGGEVEVLSGLSSGERVVLDSQGGSR